MLILKWKKRNLVLINYDTHQRETLSERPIRLPLIQMFININLPQCQWLQQTLWPLIFSPDTLIIIFYHMTWYLFAGKGLLFVCVDQHNAYKMSHSFQLFTEVVFTCQCSWQCLFLDTHTGIKQQKEDQNVLFPPCFTFHIWESNMPHT